MRRPPTTLGVLSIVFGALMLLSTIVNDQPAARLAARPMSSDSSQLNRDARIATNHALGLAGLDYMSVTNGVHIVLALALVVIGIGLCRDRDWARRAGFAWGIAANAVLAVTTLIWIVVWVPHYQALCRVTYAQHGLKFAPWQFLFYAFLLVLVSLAAVFPIVMILLLRAPTRAIHSASNP